MKSKIGIIEMRKRTFGLLLAAACFAGGLWQTMMAQETFERLEIRIEYFRDGHRNGGWIASTIPVVRDIEEFDINQFESIYGDSEEINVVLPYGLTNLTTLNLSPSFYENRSYRKIRLKGFFLPSDLRNLKTLKMVIPNFFVNKEFQLPTGLDSLESLEIDACIATEVIFPEGDWSKLKSLSLSFGNRDIYHNAEGWLRQNNRLQSQRFVLPDTAKNLRVINLSLLNLGSLVLPDGLDQLEEFRLLSNYLSEFRLPRGLSSLKTLSLSGIGILHAPSRMRHLIQSGWASEVRYYDFSVTMERIADVVKISWNGGVLQRSASVDGDWINVGDTALSPLVWPLSGEKSFFRLKQPQE